MKFLIVVATLVLVAGASSINEEWQQFKIDHGKTYRSLVEEKLRFSIYQDNVRKIQEHNEKYESGRVSFAMKVTQFADMTHQEFLDLLKTQAKATRPGNGLKFDATGIKEEETVDWRQKGAVTAVKDQKRCGSCWAFSAVGAIEGQLFLKNKTLVDLSVQDLVDCATDEYGNNGCNGGLMDNAFDYIEDHGIQTEKSYPYEGVDNACRQNGYAVKVSSYVDLKNEKEIAKAVSAHGPISAAMDGSSLSFYSHGILDEESGCNDEKDSLNHGILIVGYGSEDGVDYWIVKNSWGERWGDKGYFKLRRNVNACGIRHISSYPVL